MRDLSLHLLDIIQNSVVAKADKIDFTIEAIVEKDLLIIAIKDNGIGMDEELLVKVSDPFSTTRTTRKVGLGIPLYKAATDRSGGNLLIESVKGCGTKLLASFEIQNIDRPPLGDIADTITGTILANPKLELNINFFCNNEHFEMSTVKIKDQLGEVPINEYEVLIWIKEYLNEGLKAIFGGVLNEIDNSIGRNKEENT